MQSFELQDVVEVRLRGKREYGVVIETVPAGSSPKGSQTSRRYGQKSAVVRVEFKDGSCEAAWVEFSDLTPVYMEHAKRV